MNSMKKLIVVAVAAIACIANMQAQNRKWSLKECIDYAILHNMEVKQSLGKEVEIRTYRALDHQKEFVGILKDYDKNQVTIETQPGTVQTFEKSEIALIRLAFDF